MANKGNDRQSYWCFEDKHKWILNYFNLSDFTEKKLYWVRQRKIFYPRFDQHHRLVGNSWLYLATRFSIKDNYLVRNTLATNKHELLLCNKKGLQHSHKVSFVIRWWWNKWDGLIICFFVHNHIRSRLRCDSQKFTKTEFKSPTPWQSTIP